MKTMNFLNKHVGPELTNKKVYDKSLLVTKTIWRCRSYISISSAINKKCSDIIEKETKFSAIANFVL